jgi:predicted ABC-type ATPase
LRALAAGRVSFAFETTLASRSFAPWLRRLSLNGYAIHGLFLWLPTADVAVARVTERVRAGGHHVPDEVVRRRYRAGLHNFINLYDPLASTWAFYDSSGSEPRLVADRLEARAVRVYDEAVWPAAKSLGTR